jgi:hypothetical protein
MIFALISVERENNKVPYMQALPPSPSHNHNPSPTNKHYVYASLRMLRWMNVSYAFFFDIMFLIDGMDFKVMFLGIMDEGWW